MNMKRSSDIVITWLIFIEVFTLIINRKSIEFRTEKEKRKRRLNSVYPLCIPYVITVFNDETGIANSSRYSNSQLL